MRILAAVAAVTGAASAATVEPLVLTGDVVDGVGAVTRIDFVALASNGRWMVDADTDHVDPEADGVRLEAGGLRLREGQALAAPGGATIDVFDALALDAAGTGIWNFTLAGVVPAGNEGVYVNDVLFIQKNDPSSAPQFSAGTRYKAFYDVKLVDGGIAALVCAVDDPSIPSTQDQAILRLDYDAGAGTLAQSVVIKEGDVPPGETRAVASLYTGPHVNGMNAAGTMIYAVDLEGSGPDDTGVYLDDVRIAQEGTPSPVGDLWQPLANGVRTALNASASYAMIGPIYADDPATERILIRDGVLVARLGSPAPNIAGDPLLTSFGSGPIRLDDDGRLLWYGAWEGPEPGAALFLDDQPIVRTGATAAAGSVVTGIAGTQGGYDLTADGRFLAFEAALADGRDGAFRLDLDPCPADADDDGAVGFTDLLLVLSAWGPCPGSCPADVDGSTVVDFQDLLAVLAAWGRCG